MATKEQIKEDLQTAAEYDENSPPIEELDSAITGLNSEVEEVQTETKVTTAEPVTEELEDHPAGGWIDGYPSTEEALGEITDATYLNESPEVVGYSSLEQQEVIYDFVASNFDATQESILDFGCGRGDFLRHLEGLYQSEIKYHGVDNNKILINVAKELSPTGTFTGTDWFKLDGNYASDWVVNIQSSIIPYEPKGAEFDSFQSIKNIISKMLELADTGIVITLLSTNASDVYDESYMTHDPVEVLDWALHEYGALGGNVRLDHSIADSLFTLTIFK
tara:strand:+ start:3859 stop:4689 length:831 start_codon:yes stop_codon:yes gene_type:complete